MQLEIKFDEEINPGFYDNYSRFIYSRMKSQVHILVQKNRQKYLIREDLVLNSNLIRWKKKSRKIDLSTYVENCLQLVKINGVYIIRINPYQRLPYSFTKISTLIRILEYGTEKIPELPLLRRVFMYYRLNYKYLFVEYMRERYC